MSNVVIQRTSKKQKDKQKIKQNKKKKLIFPHGLLGGTFYDNEATRKRDN